MMKKIVFTLLAFCFLLAGCGTSQEESTGSGANPSAAGIGETEASASALDAETPEEDADAAQPAVTVQPLPDTTMDNLDNATFAISLEEGGAYLDDTGVMQMDVKIYTYDLFDMTDIAMLQEGDTIVTHSGEVEIISVERNDLGTVFINGGLEEGGFDLFSDGGGVYYEAGFNDVKNWYEVGEATLRVSDELEFKDNIDPEKGEQIFYAGSFLISEVTDYNFTPHNTTIRTENGQIVFMERIYTP